ncbi:MAG: ferrous iron transport protein B [Clostridia bacterium]|nr:ferrous iron transport protein B [Clostridia bacterium]
MGLTASSVGSRAIDSHSMLRRNPNERVIALAGNPNVGKSTIFNALTGMHQHTGNWAGKTVTNAAGRFHTKQNDYLLVDIPGTYSLFAHSPEEEVARNFICFGEVDAVVIVCDASRIERNLHLVLQIIECGIPVVVCVNLMDEARRKKISLDLDLLSKRLGVPVVGSVAKKKRTLKHLCEALDTAIGTKQTPSKAPIPYPDVIERALAIPEEILDSMPIGNLESRWLALRLLDCDCSLRKELKAYLGSTVLDDNRLAAALAEAHEILSEHAVNREVLQDLLVSSALAETKKICRDAVVCKDSSYSKLDRRLDWIFTGKRTAYPIMLLLLAFIFWLTVSASNVPSEWLSKGGFWLLEKLAIALRAIDTPIWLQGILIDGILRVPIWVISVMLPPMAIFFPLFTLLEDAGYLPRVAYNLDRPFHRCNACGKQALTMCMGFGCNAAGVVGCRIIDSPRERLLAILTNSFVPCNGRFPALIAVLTMFCIGVSGGMLSSLSSAFLLTLLILFAVLITFAATKLLSVSLLKGEASSFTLELPSFRAPQVGKVLVRSIFDRTVFVLGRAIAVAVPAGLAIWLLANVTVGDVTLLSHAASFLDPLARPMGLDGVILLAFILGFPANEIVIPLMLMAYQSNGVLTEIPSLATTKELLVANGWTWTTAVCVLVFFLFHWPCSTTLLTIKKETGSLKWTLVAAILPTLIGATMCIIFTAIVNFMA